MNQNQILLFAGIGIAAYFLYQANQNGTLLSTTSTVPSYLPIANTAGNELNCPAGTKYYPSLLPNVEGYCA